MAIRVGIAGVSGYTGVELVRLLAAHPDAELVAVAAEKAAGQRLDRVWPGLVGLTDLTVEALDPTELGRRVDVVFLALPHGVSARAAQAILAEGCRVIDLGADFRFKDAARYEATYKLKHPCPELLEHAVYGLPELNRAALADARLIANPGCYPTATAIAALPLVEAGLATWLVADCLSGISGAGRQPGPRNLYCDVAESVSAYGVSGGHRHAPEIAEVLGRPLVFTPHLVPMVRGMLATVHTQLSRPVSAAELRALYEARYADHPMVTLRDEPPSSADVRGTNRVHVHVNVNPEDGVATVVSVIDNLVKGASGQAVQNMNLAFGLPETRALPLFPWLP